MSVIRVFSISFMVADFATYEKVVVMMLRIESLLYLQNFSETLKQLGKIWPKSSKMSVKEFSFSNVAEPISTAAPEIKGCFWYNKIIPPLIFNLCLCLKI